VRLPNWWPRSATCESATARLLWLLARVQSGALISVSSERCVLSGRGLYDRLITPRKESYLLCCVSECDLKTSAMRRPSALRLSSHKKETIFCKVKIVVVCNKDLVKKSSVHISCISAT